MSDLPGHHQPLWAVDVEPASHPPLVEDTDVDVAVVGGGITGTTAALLCRQAGLRVALLEADRIASGTTGGTTGKVTSQHGRFYADALDQHGEGVVRTYARANEAAVDLLEELLDQHGIDALATRAPSLLYTRDPDQVDALRAEADAARRVGLPAAFEDTTSLPYAVAGAVRFEDQLQLHPTRLVDGLARAVATDGSVVHEHSRVLDIAEDGDAVTVSTAQATVRARHVIVATLLPIVDRGFEFARARPVRAYGIAVDLDGEPPTPMHLSIDSPSRSLRRYDGPSGTRLVVVGNSHETGHGHDLADNYRDLIDFARTHFPVREVTHRWSAQDFMPVDGLPYIGRLSFSERIQIATGLKKWGLTNGVVAARIMTDHILDQPNAWAEVFDANRGQRLASYAEMIKDNLHVAQRFAADRVTLGDREDVADLAPGQGRVVRIEGRPVAVHRTEGGELQAVAATCTHLGCLVDFNDAETSWDCPCHGSRFAPTGEVLDGPAVHPLEPVTDLG
jgi:glycine/D-amino acid oxidase-like deaminating enzyme/nitrite reductase/ring-hydroxylating ferredoxin subunit